MKPAALACAPIAFALVAGACGGGDGGGDRAGGKPASSARDPAREPAGARSPAGLEPARCPPQLAGCRSASGRIVYVERVDPDGDGDAHFVLASAESVTAPGITVVDVAPELRPHPLPGPGDALSAAGPVFRGSYDQRQIQAVTLNVGR